MKSTITTVVKLADARMSKTLFAIHSGAAAMMTPIPLIVKKSRASWWRSRPPRCLNDHSRLRM